MNKQAGGRPFGSAATPDPSSSSSEPDCDSRIRKKANISGIAPPRRTISRACVFQLVFFAMLWIVPSAYRYAKNFMTLSLKGKNFTSNKAVTDRRILVNQIGDAHQNTRANGFPSYTADGFAREEEVLN